MSTSDDGSISLVQSVCNCSRERAGELLEAGGSVDRAVDIHFSHSKLTDEGDDNKGNNHNYNSSDAVVVVVAEDYLEQHPSRKRASEALEDNVTGSQNHKRASNKGSSIIDNNTTFALSSSKAKAKTAISPSVVTSIQPPLSSFFSPGGRAKVYTGDTDVGESETEAQAVESSENLKDRNFDLSKACRKMLPFESSKDDGIDDRLQYLRLAEAFAKMVDTTKRLAKLDVLQQVLRGIIDAVGGTHQGDEISRANDGRILQYAVELILGSTTVKLQVSGSAVSKAVMSVTGATSSQLRTAYRSLGDLGDVAERFVRNQRLLIQPKPLTIEGVYQTLKQIESQEGKGSQTGRHTLIVKLLRSCKSSEMRFLVRTLLGNMRLGANMKTVLAALAIAVNNNADTKDIAIKALQDAFDYCPRLDKTCLALLVGGIPHMVATCTLEVGTCVTPMLANPAHSLGEVEKMMEEGGAAVAEWKYDGVRCQAHYMGEKRMTLFSRHMLDNTDQFPDAVLYLLQAKGPNVTSFIIDSEIVGIDRTSSSEKMVLLPFQDLSTRRGTKEDSERLPVHIFAFDLLLLNGESLVGKPLCERQRLLLQYFRVSDGFSFAQAITLQSFDEQRITEFLRTAIAGGAEGLMIKLTGTGPASTSSTDDKVERAKPACQYESGVRSHTWMKVKRDYVAGFSDTIDVVPIGAWYGNGRKAQKGFLSPVLLAVYDQEEDVFRSICRCMSFTDAMYDAMKQFYFKGIQYPDGVGIEEGVGPSAVRDDEPEAALPMENNEELSPFDDIDEEVDDDEATRVHCYQSRPTALVVTNESPSIWFKPSEVFEVSFADLSLSKQHSAAAGLVDPSRGVALRFPRFKRRRPDKLVEQATTSAEIAHLFSKQAKQKQGTRK